MTRPTLQFLEFSRLLQRGCLNLALLNLAAHEIDGILRHDNEIISSLVNFLNMARIFLRVLYEHLLIRLGILTKECLALGRIYEII